MKRARILLMVLAVLALGGWGAAPRPAMEVTQVAEFSLQALHDEIEADAAGLGYKTDGVWKEDAVIADLINAKNYTIDVASVEVGAIVATTTYAAYNTLLADEQEWLRWMTNTDQWQVTADMKLQLSGRTLCSDGVAGSGNDTDSFWAAAHDQDMAPAMLALIEQDGSRAEVLWGAGTVITISQIAHAANL